MGIHIDLTGITRELSHAITAFLNAGFRMPGMQSFSIPLWVIALVVVAVFIFAAQSRTR